MENSILKIEKLKWIVEETPCYRYEIVGNPTMACALASCEGRLLMDRDSMEGIGQEFEGWKVECIKLQN